MLAPTLFGKTVDADIAACVARAFGEIRQLEGLEIVPLEPGWEDPVAIFDLLWTARGALSRTMPAADLEQASIRALPG